MVTHRRRTVLAALASGLSALAGCGGRLGESGRREETFGVPSRTTATSGQDAASADSAITSAPAASGGPTETGRPVVVSEEGRAAPARGCPPGADAFGPPWVVVDEPLRDLLLYAEPEQLAPGETVTIKLRNVATGARRTEDRTRFDLQRRGVDGWRTVFGIGPGEFSLESGVVSHSPGLAFTWTFPFTADGVAELGAEVGYALCDPLAAGQYRFVYWGVDPASDRPKAEGAEYAVGTRFTVER